MQPKYIVYFIAGLLVAVCLTLATLFVWQAMTSEPTAAHIWCEIGGEIVFNQLFERVEIRANGGYTVWLHGQSAPFEGQGECQVVLIEAARTRP